MNYRALLLLPLLSISTFALAADYGKLLDSVDKDKAVESVDTEKLKGSVVGMDMNVKSVYDSVDKQKAAEAVDMQKAKEALAD